jgi:tetratricopeptide (TPR) repeat protein
MYSKILCDLGGARDMEGRLAEAGECFERSMQAAETFKAEHPDSLEAYLRLIESLERCAILGARIGAYGDTANIFKWCGELWDYVRASWPEESGSQMLRMDYAGYLSNRAYYAYELNEEEKDFGPAMEYMLDALSIFEGLREEEPDVLTFRLSCAGQIARITSVAIKSRNFETAEEYYSAGEELWRDLVSDDPSHLLYSYGWAGMLMDGALLRAEQGRRSEAESMLDRAGEIIGELLRKQPGDERYLARKSQIEEYRQSVRQKTETAPSGERTDPSFPQSQFREERRDER